MPKSNNAVLVAIIAAALLTVMPVIVLSDGSSAENDMAVADFYGGSMEVKAGSSSSFDVVFTNTQPYLDHDASNSRIITVSASVVDGSGNPVEDATAKAVLKDGSGSRAILEGQASAEYVITVTIGDYVHRGDYVVSYTYSVYEMDMTSVGDAVSETHAFKVTSNNSAENSYNKFLGIFPNNFDGFLGSVLFTAIATFLIIFGMGVVVSAILAFVVSVIMEPRGSPGRKQLRGPLFRVFSAAFAVNAAYMALMVTGISNEDAAKIGSICNVIYVLIIAYIVWKVYGAILERFGNRIQSRDSRDALDNFLSFKPLFMYLGKIIIAIFTVFSIMSMFGFDMAAIITSAGLITMGITFGAQQILSQFFAGLLLLSSRPFKKGDLIQLGSDTVYRVRKVNVMSTELENWDNSDITIVPNNSLTASHVKNITRDTLRTKEYIFVGVGYGCDLDVARNLMMECAAVQAHVINEGPMAPATRIIDFQDSNILLRLAVWVDDFNVAGGVGGDLRDAMYKKFNAAGIPIDYPQVVIHNADRVE